MKQNKSWTVRLTGACECFSEKDEHGQIEVSNFCQLKDKCSKYELWRLLYSSSQGLPAGTVPPLQIPFTTALLRAGLYTRTEIISAICEVFDVQISRANQIYQNTVTKLKNKGVNCLKTDNNIRYLN